MGTIEARISALNDGADVKIIGETMLADGAKLLKCHLTGGEWNVDEVFNAVIVYEDGTLFHLLDWQGEQPETAEDVPNFDWVTEDGHPAVVLSGLPRRL